MEASRPFKEEIIAIQVRKSTALPKVEAVENGVRGMYLRETLKR